MVTLYFMGKIDPSINTATASIRLAQLFKASSTDPFANWFSGNKIVIKENILMDEARQYQALFAQHGIFLEIDDYSKDDDVAIWNPNAAANWSLIFTPTFGTYIQMLNWQALGEPSKAASSKRWLYASLVMLLIYIIIAIRLAIIVKNNPNIGPVESPAAFFAFIFTVLWYFFSGRKQGKYVKEKFGKTYAKRPWGKALLVGVGGIIGYGFISFVIGFLVSSIL